MGLNGPFDDRSSGIVSDLRGNPLENASVEIFLNGESVPFELRIRRPCLAKTPGMPRVEAE